MAARAEDGVACFLCHSMAAVAEGADPHPEKRITRGDKGVMYGPLDDATDAVVHGTKKSELHEGEGVCLACHDHDVPAAGGAPCCTVVRDWRDSEVRDYMRCQSCHMRASRDTPVARGGPKRTHHRHDFPAAGDVDQARGGWELAIAKTARGVNVTLTNKAGHALPNGEPYGTRVVVRAEARGEGGAILGSAEQSIGFEMLDAAGRPTIFAHEAAKRGVSTAVASGEERVLRFELPPAASYVATLGYAAFAPPAAALARVDELRAWIRSNRPQVQLRLQRLDGAVQALARPMPIRTVRWPE